MENFVQEYLKNYGPTHYVNSFFNKYQQEISQINQEILRGSDEKLTPEIFKQKQAQLLDLFAKKFGDRFYVEAKNQLGNIDWKPKDQILYWIEIPKKRNILVSTFYKHENAEISILYQKNNMMEKETNIFELINNNSKTRDISLYESNNYIDDICIHYYIIGEIICSDYLGMLYQDGTDISIIFNAKNLNNANYPTWNLTINSNITGNFVSSGFNFDELDYDMWDKFYENLSDKIPLYIYIRSKKYVIYWKLLSNPIKIQSYFTIS